MNIRDDAPLVVVTPRSMTENPSSQPLTALRDRGFRLAFARQGSIPSEEELIDLLLGASGYIAGVEAVTARVIQAAPQLRAISRNGSGVDNIDVEAAQRAGIQICRATGANATGVAELTVAAVLALFRSIPQVSMALKDGRWQRQCGRELRSATVGLVGVGTIGSEVAKLMQAMAAETIGYDALVSDTTIRRSGCRPASLQELLESSDVVSLHASVSQDGSPLLGRAELALMKDGAYLVNTARASLVDEEAVLQALEDGKLAGYAVDAYSKEPPTDFRLIQHERVIATPHIGAYTRESGTRAAMAAVRNLIGCLERGKCEDV